MGAGVDGGSKVGVFEGRRSDLGAVVGVGPEVSSGVIEEVGSNVALGEGVGVGAVTGVGPGSKILCACSTALGKAMTFGGSNSRYCAMTGLVPLEPSGKMPSFSRLK